MFLGGAGYLKHLFRQQCTRSVTQSTGERPVGSLKRTAACATAEAQLDWAIPCMPGVELSELQDTSSPQSWDPPGTQYPGFGRSSSVEAVDVQTPMSDAACLATIRANPATAGPTSATAVAQQLMPAHMEALRDMHRDPLTGRRLRPFEALVVSRDGSVTRVRTVPIELGKAAAQPAGVAFVRSRELAQARDQPVMRFVPFLGEDEDVDKMRDACVYDARPDLPTAWRRRMEAQTALFCACKAILEAASGGEQATAAALRACPKRVLRALLLPRRVRPSSAREHGAGAHSALPLQLLHEEEMEHAGHRGILPVSGPADVAASLSGSQPWRTNGSFTVPPSALGVTAGIFAGATAGVLRGVTYLVEVPAQLALRLHSSMLSHLLTMPAHELQALGPPSSQLGRTTLASRDQQPKMETGLDRTGYLANGSTASVAKAAGSDAAASAGPTKPSWRRAVQATRRSVGPMQSQLCIFCFKYACTQHKGSDAAASTDQELIPLSAPPAALMSEATVSERKGDPTVPLGMVMDDEAACGLLGAAGIDPSGQPSQRRLPRMLRCPADDYHLKGFRRLRGRQLLRGVQRVVQDSAGLHEAQLRSSHGAEPGPITIGTKRDRLGEPAVAPESKQDAEGSESEDSTQSTAVDERLDAFFKWAEAVSGCGHQCYARCIGGRQSKFVVCLAGIGKLNSRSTLPAPIHLRQGDIIGTPHVLCLRPMHIDGMAAQLDRACEWDNHNRTMAVASDTEEVVRVARTQDGAGARRAGLERRREPSRRKHRAPKRTGTITAGMLGSVSPGGLCGSGGTSIDAHEAELAKAAPIRSTVGEWVASESDDLSKAVDPLLPAFSIQRVVQDGATPKGYASAPGSRLGMIHGETSLGIGVHLPASSSRWEAADRSSPSDCRGFSGVVMPPTGWWHMSGKLRVWQADAWLRVHAELTECEHVFGAASEPGQSSSIEPLAGSMGDGSARNMCAVGMTATDGSGSYKSLPVLSESSALALEQCEAILRDEVATGLVLKAHAVCSGCVCTAAELLGCSCLVTGLVLERIGVACWALDPVEATHDARQEVKSPGVGQASGMAATQGADASPLTQLLDPVADADALQGNYPGTGDVILSMRLGTWEGLDRLKTPPRKHSNRRRVMVWCDHDGPCNSEASQCKCVIAGTVCSKNCGCDETCKNKWSGCVCGRKGQVCSTRNGCPCVASGRECDPDVCQTCECLIAHQIGLRHSAAQASSSTLQTGDWSLQLRQAAVKLGGDPTLLLPPILSDHFDSSSHGRGSADRVGALAAAQAAVKRYSDVWARELAGMQAYGSTANVSPSRKNGPVMPRMHTLARLVAAAPEAAVRACVARDAMQSQMRHKLEPFRGIAGQTGPLIHPVAAVQGALACWASIAFSSGKQLVAEQLVSQSCSNSRVLSRLHHTVRPGVSAVPHAGYGLFATAPVRGGRLLLEYTGERLGELESERRGQLYDARNRSYLFDLDDQDGGVDATRLGNKMRFANHMGKGHVLQNSRQRQLLSLARERIGLFACRPIQANEELFFDYGYSNKRANSERAKHVGWIKDARMAGRVQTGMVSSEGAKQPSKRPGTSAAVSEAHTDDPLYDGQRPKPGGRGRGRGSRRGRGRGRGRGQRRGRGRGSRGRGAATFSVVDLVG